MIAERIPQIRSLSLDEKWQLLVELEDELWELDHDDSRSHAILAALETRRSHYQAHPETAMSLEEARQRMFASRK